MGLTISRARGVARSLRLVALLLAGATLPLAAQSKSANEPKKPKEPPDSAKMAEWMAEANALPLFKSADPVAFTLIADYRTVFKDRDTLSTKEYPGTLIIDSAGAEKKIAVKLRTRGHWRLMSRNCSFVPLRINLPKKEMVGTVLEGHDKVKLGTHCQNNKDYEQYVLREHLAYRLHNTLSDRSFRTRLARVTYMDSVTNKSFDTHNAILFEDEDHVAHRLGGEAMPELRRALFDDVDFNQMNETAIFEYFVGNTDWSLYALHNIKLMRKLDGTLLPLAYDLDFSGLVRTRYATPDYRLPIRSVKDRLYRGPCRTVEDLEPVLAVYRQKEADVLAVYDNVAGLDPRYVKEAKDYLKEFFDILKKPRAVKSTFVDSCEGKPSV